LLFAGSLADRGDVRFQVCPETINGVVTGYHGRSSFGEEAYRGPNGCVNHR
jgi:hypothetical protein